jgi:hypothetical protein
MIQRGWTASVGAVFPSLGRRNDDDEEREIK